MNIDPSGSIFSSGTISASGGILLPRLIPNLTSNVLYNNFGELYFDGSILNTNTQLTQEQVEDHVGGMLDGTETFISVSYDDGDGNIDFCSSRQR